MGGRHACPQLAVRDRPPGREDGARCEDGGRAHHRALHEDAAVAQDGRITDRRGPEQAALADGHAADLLHRVETAARGEEETRGSGRTAAIAQLLDPAQRHPTAHNVYLLPYLGATYQGYAQLGGKQVVVGVWTDKPSGGKQPPVKALLVEPEPMRVGSLARTIAHELGHNLGLVHPDKAEAAEVGRLMGGGRQGYALTPAEIAAARKTARKSAEGK